MSIERFSAAILLALVLIGTAPARAQVVESAQNRQLSVVAGGMVSVFQPDFAGNWPYYEPNPISGSSSYPLIGIGAYVDVNFSRWVGIEAEGRWLRFNQYQDITQSNYLIGPKVPVTRLGKIDLYGKALIGFSDMNFGIYDATGRFTDIAFGGGGDIKINRRLYFRPFDFEYQYWPKWGNSTLKPYGASAGFAYRIY